MSAVAITGAMGYVGGRLVARLIADPNVERIIAFDLRPPSPPLPQKMIYYQMDICEPTLDERLRQHRVDRLIHAAFVLFPHPQRLERMKRSNIRGTANVLRAAREARVRRLVVLSSTTVYGAWPDNPIPLTEEHPPHPNPDYHYGMHKGEIEAMCRDFSQENPSIACAVLRPPGILGPHFRGPLADLLRGPWVLNIDGGRAPTQFVHEEDVVNLIWRALEAGARGVFNATPDDWLPWRELWSSAGRRLLTMSWSVARPLFGTLWRFGALGCVTHPAQVNLARFSFVASNKKARRELGWRPLHTTLQAVQDFPGRNPR